MEGDICQEVLTEFVKASDLISEPPRTKFDDAGITKIYFLYKLVVEDAKNKKRYRRRK